MAHSNETGGQCRKVFSQEEIDESNMKKCENDINSGIQAKRKKKIPLKFKEYIVREPSGYCPKCNVYVKYDDEGVVCGECNAFWHFVCAEVTQREIDEIWKEDFSCINHREAVSKESDKMDSKEGELMMLNVAVISDVKNGKQKDDVYDSQRDISKSTDIEDVRKVVTDFKMNTYTLNKKEALKKKLAIIEKKFEIEMKDSGRQYKVMVNAVTYQILADNIKLFCRKMGGEIKRLDFDKAGAGVQAQYNLSLCRDTDDTPITVICYHTTSNFLFQLKGSKKKDGWKEKLSQLKTFINGPMVELIREIEKLPEYERIKIECKQNLLSAVNGEMNSSDVTTAETSQINEVIIKECAVEINQGNKDAANIQSPVDIYAFMHDSGSNDTGIQGASSNVVSQTEDGNRNGDDASMASNERKVKVKGGMKNKTKKDNLNKDKDKKEVISGCEVAKKKPVTINNNLVLTLQNNISWWSEDTLRNLRNYLHPECEGSVINNSEHKELVPFQVEQSQDGGVIGGLLKLNLSPQNENMVWYDQVDVVQIQVNCANLLKLWNNNSKNPYIRL